MTATLSRSVGWRLALVLACLGAGCRSASLRVPDSGAAREEGAAAPRAPQEEPEPGGRADAPEEALAEEEERDFTVDASLAYYVLPGEDDIAMPVVQVDSDWIHLEARYNYEDRNTGSVFAGANWGTGEELRFDATLMAGAAAGATDGFAPGYRLSLGWRFLEFATEGEYLFSIEGSDEDFFYSWSELSAAPLDWLFLGVAAQRLRPVESDLTLDVGPFAGVAFASLEFAAYVMNPGGDDAFYVFSAGVSF